MPTYTTSAKVSIHLPSSPPAAVTAQVAADIADAGVVVDSMAGSRFGLNYKSSAQKFPDITDDPATPALIEQCARYLAAATQMDRIGDQVKEGKTTRADRLRKQAYEWLQMISEGKANIYISGAEIGSSNLAGVEDTEMYTDNNNEPFFTMDNLNAHLNH